MAQQAEQGIQKGDVLQKIAGVSLIVGSLFLIIGNALIPRGADPSDVAEFIAEAADNAGGFTEVVFLLLTVGMGALVLGTAGVYRAISSGTASAWARMGFYGFMVGTAVFIGMAGMFGLGFASVAEEWDSMAAGADKDALFQAFTALYWAINGAFAVSIVAYWGTMAVLFVGITLSATFPKWIGWAGLINALVVVAIGFAYAFADLSEGLDLTFGAAAGLSTIWPLALGVVTVRKAF